MDKWFSKFVFSSWVLLNHNSPEIWEAEECLVYKQDKETNKLLGWSRAILLEVTEAWLLWKIIYMLFSPRKVTFTEISLYLNGYFNLASERKYA